MNKEKTSGIGVSGLLGQMNKLKNLTLERIEY